MATIPQPRVAMSLRPRVPTWALTILDRYDFEVWEQRYPPPPARLTFGYVIP